ncbi:MFS transporter [Bacillus sp. J14TS2]|uniref:MFS transporter n=1 Tax=Bacillus sp. J14TS2 TaxID=2807188 RepID=UPI001B138195|nr:MFS transporter [Bacillus sp. J14TS2]GIN69726.1 MFS transporter [Bacillus sp. J14TS2]
MNKDWRLKRATYHLWTFVSSKMISTFGAQVYAFAISFYILQTTGSAASFAINLLCNIVPRAIAAPFAGYVADKYSRKMIVIFAQIATILAIGGLLTITLTFGLSLTAIYVTTAILSLTSTFSGVTFTSSISGLVDQDRIQKAMSFNQMSISFAAIASPAIGGLLYGIISIPVFLALYMMASFIAVLLEATMNFNLFAVRREINKEEKETMWASMSAGIAYLKFKPVIMTIIWLSLSINFFMGAFEVGYSYVLIEKLKIASQDFGFTQGAFATGMLLMSIYFSITKEVKYPLLVAKRGVLWIGVIIGSMAIPLIISFSYTTIFTFYIILMLSFGGLVILINTPIQVMMQKQIDDDYKGRIFSILETMSMALMPLGTILYGFLYDLFSAQWILIGSALLLLVAVIVMARPSIIRKAHPELEISEAKAAESSV